MEREGPSCFLQVARRLVALDRYPGESSASGLVTVGSGLRGGVFGSRTDRDSTLVDRIGRAYGTLVYGFAWVLQPNTVSGTALERSLADLEESGEVLSFLYGGSSNWREVFGGELQI